MGKSECAKEGGCSSGCAEVGGCPSDYVALSISIISLILLFARAASPFLIHKVRRPKGSSFWLPAIQLLASFDLLLSLVMSLRIFKYTAAHRWRSCYIWAVWFEGPLGFGLLLSSRITQAFQLYHIFLKRRLPPIRSYIFLPLILLPWVALSAFLHLRGPLNGRCHMGIHYIIPNMSLHGLYIAALVAFTGAIHHIEFRFHELKDLWRGILVSTTSVVIWIVSYVLNEIYEETEWLQATSRFMLLLAAGVLVLAFFSVSSSQPLVSVMSLKNKENQDFSTMGWALGIPDRGQLLHREPAKVLDPNEPLEKLLLDKRFLQSFMEFADSCLAGESVHFYDELQQHDKIPVSDTVRRIYMARHIIENYITAGALMEVNISHRSRQDILTTADLAHPDLFRNALNEIIQLMKMVLKDGLSTVHAPYEYGFAIILLTVLVKAATFPLTKKQVESAMAMRSMQPQIKAIQQRYAGDQEKIQIETARLYKLVGINPLAGCLPTLATIPVWIGLYRALSNVADEGLLTEGFFWIPSLAGPTTVAARQNGSGVSWLFPFIDGHPPLGWSDTFAYLVLPVLLVVSQYISVQVMQTSQSDDPNLKTSQAITKFLPLMIGYFALSVPSGLSLYWLTNNILSTAQQVYLQKLGGARNPMSQFTDDSVTKELSKNQVSAIETTETKLALKEEKKQTPEGPRPGDRFKQLKEEEARKKKQREEEGRKANVVAENSVSVTNGKLKTETCSVEIEDRQTESLYANDFLATENPSINGNQSSQELKEDQEISSWRTENDENSSNCSFGEDVQQHLHENLKKEEAVATLGTGENKLSADDTKSQDRC